MQEKTKITQPTEHLTKQDAIAAAEDQLETATEGDHFMAVVFRAERNGQLHLDRTTWDFPSEDFKMAVELLAENLKVK